MSRFAKRLVLGIAIVAVVVIVAVLVWPRGEQGSPPANGLVQQSSGGNVTIDVTWMGAAEGLLLFDVAMNTHSVNLDLYELSELAMLRDNEGNEYPPVSWLSAPGGHHRMGTLSFTLPQSVSEARAKYVQLIIRDVAGGEERTLTWQFGQ